MSTTTTAAETFSLVKRIDLFKVPASKLKVQEGLNIRFDYGNIDELVDSIRENGVKVPFRGYKDKDGLFVITDGHRRNKACQILLEEGLEVSVPFILEAKGYNDEQRLIDMFVMNEGKSLSTLEQAEGIRRFIAYGYSEKEIAAKLAKSEGYIRKLNSLNAAPKKFIDLIKKGQLSGTLAIEIIAKGQVQEVLDQANSNKAIEIEADTSDELFSNDGNALVNDGSKSGSEKKITKKDLQKVNSLAAFKKVTKNFDSENKMMSNDQSLVYEMVWRLINNELSEEDIKEFFL